MNKPLPKTIALAIFDLDGTLIDSTSLWADIDKAFFAKRGREVPEGYAREVSHIGLKKASILTASKYVPGENSEDILQEWIKASEEAYANSIPLKEGALEVLEALKDKGIPMAVATANNRSLYLPCIERLGIRPYFSYLEDGESCQEGKKTGEVYDRLTNLFKAQPENTLVFDDIYKPLASAYSKGYFTIGVYDASSSKEQAKIRSVSSLYIKALFEFLEVFR